jgi:hypothetical protein
VGVIVVPSKRLLQNPPECGPGRVDRMLSASNAFVVCAILGARRPASHMCPLIWRCNVNLGIVVSSKHFILVAEEEEEENEDGSICAGGRGGGGGGGGALGRFVAVDLWVVATGGGGVGRQLQHY